jgi:hypothetical protein
MCEIYIRAAWQMLSEKVTKHPSADSRAHRAPCRALTNYTFKRFEAETRPYHKPESLTVRFWLRKST